MLCASVMRGTAILPRSDEVWVNIVRSEFVRVDVRLASKVCRSGDPSLLSNILGYRRYRAPWSDFGCRISALITLQERLRRWGQLEETKAPLFPWNLLLWKTMISNWGEDRYEERRTSPAYTWNHVVFFGFFSENVTIIWPLLLAPPSTPFQKASTFSSTRLSVPGSATPGYRRLEFARWD